MDNHQQVHDENQPHIVIFPFVLQSHIKPLLCLAEFLSQAGLLVTFVLTHQNHSRLVDTLALPSRHRLPNLRLVPISDGFPDDFPRTLGYNYISAMRSATKPHLKELLQSLSSPPVTCMISDGIMSFPIEVAEELKIPVFTFYVCGPRYLWAIFNLPKLVEKGELPFADDGDMNQEICHDVPELEGLKRRDLPPFCMSKYHHPNLEFYIKEHLAMTRSSGLILNTLDDPSLPHLRHLFQKIYTVGPLHSLSSTISDQSNGCLRQEEESCLTWLDSQPSKSVIYVSFGSVVSTTRNQLLEFWHALVYSDYPFLFVLRSDLIRDMTLEELKVCPNGRGYVVGWAPQERVLAHRAVGGFLTHGGWNSIMESIAARVPMICWPPQLSADCSINSKLVSKEWGIGVELDASDRETIKGSIKKFMETQRAEIQKSIDGIGKLAWDSISPGGSSYNNLEMLIKDITKMQHKGD